MSVVDNDDAYIGAWSPEEVQELTTIVRSMMSQQGGTTAGISWADVAARMGHKRNGQQCRNKWCDSAALSSKKLCRKKLTFAGPALLSSLQGTVLTWPRRTLKAGVVRSRHVHLHAQVSCPTRRSSRQTDLSPLNKISANTKKKHQSHVDLRSRRERDNLEQVS